MIDTIVIISPNISEELAQKIESISVVRTGIDYLNGELLYRFTNKELKGSYDSSIRITVKREKYISEYDLRTKKNITYKVICEPYVEVETSLHKFFLGHNIIGGSDDLVYQVKELLKFINKQFNIYLPEFNGWVIKRLDYARVYNLSDSINEFFKGFNNVYYPRRRCLKYDDTGLYFPGAYTTLKIYDKGAEFKKHDKKKLIKCMKLEKVKELEEISKGKLRIELEVHSKKLKHLYNDLPKIVDINIEDIKEQFEIEIKRTFKFGENKMKIYNNSKDVTNILKKAYGTEGNLYLGTWYKLSIYGYETVKNEMPKTTFYRHIQKLKDVNVSWNHTDLRIEENKVLEFVFNPLNTELEIKEDLVKELVI